ncbi:DUF397 domain-containing protein [Streptomyces sp. UNOC14_S4]|uniref:DUF397 domain-containing protein n=1 Tax=Streptomyces sp. UNOC14_S4 TaxID=2872340 RepID=UPI001E58E54F|nr:DUF397 domain-containing protein [Streptomyces sp. UNOC14_S4]MCC3768216.1 DUF397 domain-containing protein [Streptomyces sp. UNOC14_S4]
MSRLPEWFKSSYSGGEPGTTCVEAISLYVGGLRIRDSKLDLRAHLAIPAHAWAEFIGHATTGA